MDKEIDHLIATFQRLREITSQLPVEKSRRKSLIEIAGYPRWENVVSNFLAFYLDESEEHQFSKLFFGAFLELLKEKWCSEIVVDFETCFQVEREVNNIDILISSVDTNESWAILIENKIGANLYNDLEVYWNSIEAKYKFGIVLSINPIDAITMSFFKSKGVEFITVTYIELLPKIREGLKEAFLESDDRHLLYLKDFIANLDSQYKKPQMEILEKKLALYQENISDIENFVAVKKQLREFVIETVMQIMDRRFGWKPSSLSTATDSKHFYEKETDNEAFRFFFHFPSLLDHNQLTLYFELYKDYSKYGDLVRSEIKKLDISGLDLQYGEGGGVRNFYCHLFKMERFTLSNSDLKLENKLYEVLERNLFNQETGVVPRAIAILKKVLAKENEIDAAGR